MANFSPEIDSEIHFDVYWRQKMTTRNRLFLDQKQPPTVDVDDVPDVPEILQTILKHFS